MTMSGEEGGVLWVVVYVVFVPSSDMTVCRCKVCGEEVLHHLLKKHMKRHNCSLTKAQYEYVKETYHR